MGSRHQASIERKLLLLTISIGTSVKGRGLVEVVTVNTTGYNRRSVSMDVVSI